MPNAEQATTFLCAALGAELVYEGLLRADSPIGGPDIECELGFLEGTRLRCVRLIRLTDGPNIEIFEIEASARSGRRG